MAGSEKLGKKECEIKVMNMGIDDGEQYRPKKLKKRGDGLWLITNQNKVRLFPLCSPDNLAGS